MSEPITIDLRPIARRLRISYRQVEAVVQLLEEGKTVPFIARYRKDQTGGLEEEQIRRVRTLFHQARLLAHRKESILRSLQLQGAWTPELDRQIRSATTRRRLEDLYLPYKPKKDGLATTARLRGLQPLAEEILQAAPSCANLEARAADFVNPDKQVGTPADALLGAGHILAEMISEHAELRKKLREVFYRTGRICSQVVETLPYPPGWEDRKPPSASATAAGPEVPDAAEKPQDTSPEAMASEESQETSTAWEQSQMSAAFGDPKTVAAEQLPAAEPGSTGSCVESHSARPMFPEQPGLPKSSESSESVGDVEGLGGRQDAGQVGSDVGDTSKTSGTTVGLSQNGSPNAPPRSHPSGAPESDSAPVPTPPSRASGEAGASGCSDTVDSAPTQPGEKSSESATRSPLSPCLEAEAGVSSEVARLPDAGSDSSGFGEQGGKRVASEVEPEASAAHLSGSLRHAELRAQRKALLKEREFLRRYRAYQQFFYFQEPIRKISAYRVLTLNRAERQKFVRVWIECDREAMREVVYRECIPPDHPHADFLRGCAEDALQRLLLPSLEREARAELAEKAEAHAVAVVSKSLQKMLMQRPIRGKRILAVDPGLDSGCVLVALDEFGNLLEHAKVYLAGRYRDREAARQKLLQLIQRYRIGLVAIGDGLGSRSFEKLLAELLYAELKTEEVRYGIVSEIGAKVYARSMVGQEEFPYYEMRVRSAIFIGRRVMDPLSELVKIDPIYLATGVYQYDVKAKHLQPHLEEVVESCVNRVGVDVNTAHPWLLRYVSGLNMVLARRVEEYRREHGQFRTRTELKEIPGFGEGTFELAAGFLKISQGPELLDRTAIHPDCYELARKILGKISAQPEDLCNPATALMVQKQLGQLDAQTLSQELGAGPWMVRQVLRELRQAGRDVRLDSPAPSFKRVQLKPEDLKPDMELSGTVVHITTFGAFVDIGVGNNGLVHISQMADHYVRDPREVVSVGDSVKVWVLQVDPERGRISLSLIPPDRRAKLPAQAPRSEQAPSEKPPSARPRTPRAEAERISAASGGGPTAREPASRTTGARPSTTERKPRSSTRQFRSKTPPPPPPKLSEAVKQGKQPMRTFAELLQFFQLSRQQASCSPPPTESASQTSGVSSAAAESPPLSETIVPSTQPAHSSEVPAPSVSGSSGESLSACKVNSPEMRTPPEQSDTPTADSLQPSATTGAENLSPDSPPPQESG